MNGESTFFKNQTFVHGFFYVSSGVKKIQIDFNFTAKVILWKGVGYGYFIQYILFVKIQIDFKFIIVLYFVFFSEQCFNRMFIKVYGVFYTFFSTDSSCFTIDS